MHANKTSVYQMLQHMDQQQQYSPENYVKLKIQNPESPSRKKKITFSSESFWGFTFVSGV